MGFALTLDTDSIGAVLLDDGEAIEAGSRVTGTGEVVRVPVGPGLLGRIVDPLGRPLDRDEPVEAEAQMPVERPAPAIIERDLVSEPVQTGILTVDALFAIGRGQRELIIGDRATGKTAIGVDTIINQKHTDIVCVYVAMASARPRCGGSSKRCSSTAPPSAASLSWPRRRPRPDCNGSRLSPVLRSPSISGITASMR
jgi:F-type H+-transporting ATPase subunit alpha